MDKDCFKMLTRTKATAPKLTNKPLADPLPLDCVLMGCVVRRPHFFDGSSEQNGGGQLIISSFLNWLSMQK